MQKARTIRRLALAGSALLGLSGAALEPARAATVTASIERMAFGGIAGPVHVGDVVEWSNRDFVAHTVTARDGSFDLVIPPGKTGRTAMKHAGRITFFCRFHPTMTGDVEVAP